MSDKDLAAGNTAVAPASQASATKQPSAPSAAAPVGQYPMASLYVGDLHQNVTESMLYNKFSAAGAVLSIRVCRDAITRHSLGYAYVNFAQPRDAETALDTMNFDIMSNKPIRIMWSQRDPTARRSGSSNVFIKNLDPHIDTKSIYDTFSMFGTILSCKIASDSEGKSKGFGFIHFEKEEDAQKAIDKVNGMLLDNKVVFVGKFQPRAARLREMGESPHQFTNVYVKNFADKLDDTKFRELFEKCGPIASCVVMKDAEEKSRGFGFVSFENPEDAERAVNELNGYEIPNSELKLTVCRAQKKAERTAELTRAYEKLKAERIQRYQGVNLYVKNLDDSVDSDELRRTFSPFGTITSAKVMQDETGRSKGFGFVCFEKPDDASKAVLDMNNRMLNNKPLYVALAQRKEDRKAQLASQYMQRMASMRIQTPAAMPGYQQSGGFYAPAAMQPQRAPYVPNPIPAQMRAPVMPRYGVPNASYPPMQGYMVPQNQFALPRAAPRQQATVRSQYSGVGGRPQARPGAGPIIGQSGPRQQQASQQGKANYYQPLPQQSIRQDTQQSAPIQQNDLSKHPAPQSELSHKLSSAAPQEQKQILGEKLYSLVSAHCNSDQVGKITGMMLEMETPELLNMLDNPELLKERVTEASNVLQQSKPVGP